MRMVTFIFALSFLTTLGWRVHSTLTDWSTPLQFSLSPIHKLVNAVSSQHINQKEMIVASDTDIKNYLSNIDTSLNKQIVVAKRTIKKTPLLASTRKINSVAKVAQFKIKEIKSEKTKFGLPENPFETIEYKIHYKEQTYDYIAFEFKHPRQNTESIEQVVSTQMAKSESVAETKKETDPVLEEDDVKVFEYSDNDQVAKVEENPLVSTQKTDVSQNVDRAIQREMLQNPSVNATKTQEKSAVRMVAGSIGPQVEQKKALIPFNISPINEQTAAPIEPNRQTVAMNDPIKSAEKSNESGKNLVSTQEIQIQAERVDFSGKEVSIQRFEVIPFDDENEIISADSEGMIKMNMGEAQSRLISLRAEGYLTTDIKISSDNPDMSVPMLAQEELELLLNRYKLHGEGAYLAVQLDDEIKNVVLDKPYESKVFLDNHFKIVAQDKAPQFVLFIGIAPGNTMIGYDFSNDKKINKIVYLSESELYVDNEGFEKKTDFEYSLYTKELMGQGKTPLNVSGDLVASFNDNQTSKKSTLNSYEFKDLVTSKNEANYFELRLPEHNIFFTARDRSEIELPSKTYYNEILAQFNLDQLKESCVVQLNLNNQKKIDLLKFNGRSYQGFENIDLIALDNDGSLGSEVSDTTKKIFLSGNAQGVINLKLKYTDGTIDYEQTYCSPGIYLVEQL